MTIEDYSGAGDLALFGENWARYGSYMEAPGTTLYITGRVQGRFYNPSQLELSIGNVQFLDSVKNSLIENITIYLPETSIDEDLVVRLTEALEQSPGRADLFINIIDAENNIPVCLQKRGGGVTVTKKLMEVLDDRSITYTINQ